MMGAPAHRAMQLAALVASGTFLACLPCASDASCGAGKQCLGGVCRQAFVSNGGSSGSIFSNFSGTSSAAPASSMGGAVSMGNAFPQTCPEAGNVAKFSGDYTPNGTCQLNLDCVHPGDAVITHGVWSSHAGDFRQLRIRLDPDDHTQGTPWQFALGVQAIPGESLHVGHFADAEQYLSETPGHPGLDIRGNGNACPSLCGEFTIQRLVIDADAGTVDEIEASWTQRCGCQTARMNGCIHWVRPRYDGGM